MRLWPRARSDRDFRDEIEAHLAHEADDIAARQGLAPRDALAAARKQFGNVGLAAERFHDANAAAWLDTLRRNAAYAARGLLRAPTFTVVAVLTIAFGVGLNTSVFTMLYAFTMRTLPVADGARVVNVWRSFRKSPMREVRRNSWTLSYPEYLALRDGNHTFDGLTASYDQAVAFSGATAASTSPDDVVSTDADVQFVSCNYFSALHVPVARGRGFRDEECARLGDGPAIVLSDAAWRTTFGGDASIVGRRILVNQVPLTVIGIAAPGFDGLTLSQAHAWIPLTMHPALSHGRDSIIIREASWLDVLGRLRAGVTPERANADLQVIARQYDGHFENRESAIAVRRGSYAPGPDVADGGATLTIAILGGAAVILLMACANVMNLLIARAASRRREIGIRLAIGASRGQLVAQLMTESVVLAVLGGAAGIAVAYEFPKLMFSAVVGSFGIDRMNLSPDATVFGYALAASLLSALAFGVLPALNATRLQVTAALRGESPTLGRRTGTSRTRQTMVGVQVAGSAMLLVVAGLLMRSAHAARSINPGFDTQHLTTVSLDVARQGYAPEHAATLYRELRESIAALPGVRGVALTRYAPLAIGNMMTFTAGDAPDGEGVHSNVRVNVVSPDYFATIGVPLRAGRVATPDEVSASSEHLAVVSAKMARLFWPGANPVGQRFHSGNSHWIVTGVAADARNGSIDEIDHAFVYEAAKRDPTGLQLIVRDSAAAGANVGAIRRVVHALDPHLVVQVQPYETQLARVLRPARVSAWLTALMASLAALLAVVGVYGVTSFNVTQRTRELGVRLALGAPRRAIVALVMRRGLSVVAIGLCIGLALAGGATMVLRSFLVGVSPLDPVAFVGMSALLVVAATVAMAGPVLRALRVDPAGSLRGD